MTASQEVVTPLNPREVYPPLEDGQETGSRVSFAFAIPLAISTLNSLPATAIVSKKTY